MRVNNGWRVTAGSLAALVAVGCRDHPTAPTTESVIATATMAALSPTQVDTIVGSMLPIVVELNDRSGKPLAGVAVQFTGPSGSVNAGRSYTAVSYTAVDGSATAAVVVPRLPGTYAYVAHVPNGPTVSFTVRASHGPPAVVVANTEVLVAAIAGSPQYPSVFVRDAYANALSGVTVSFVVGGPAGASLDHSATVTDDSGYATPGAWSVGTAVGEYTLTAAVAGTGAYAPLVVFRADVNPTFPVAAMAAGQYSGCAIAAAGAPGTYCWGGAFNPSRLGDPGEMSTRPAAIPNAPPLVAVAVGNAHACGLTVDGAAWCWGDNSSGQTGGPMSATAPAAIHAVPGQLAFRQIVAGREFTCGLARDGTAWCWGDGSTGQIGNGVRAASRSPTAVSGNLVFSALAAGDQHACGLTAAGEVWCWGSNETGQLGASSAATCRTINAAVTDYYYYGPDSILVSCALAPIKAAGAPPLASISASMITCGLGVGGSAVCWGGQYGSAALIMSTPAASLSQVVAAGGGVCALARTGEVYCGSSSPLKRAGPAVPVRSITAGLSHQCAVARDSGIAYCWGANGAGQLGNGTQVSSTTAIPVAAPLAYGQTR